MKQRKKGFAEQTSLQHCSSPRARSLRRGPNQPISPGRPSSLTCLISVGANPLAPCRTQLFAFFCQKDGTGAYLPELLGPRNV
ncbi:hypothetical protein FA13DRAFT_254113 [Coprinellus micaceus]|uniref:Uncharacterized protein n=1 Tax=Coprinellus micaceus TaxID=71717 RepID=A0A4Y7TE79_COPMI|nr:hypothetical protein FA13DRAFT_254113 [Coprinellus micaceus]